MSALVNSLLATFGVSLVAFVGILFAGRRWNAKRETRLVSFAAGVLLATVFLDLLPEALRIAGGNPEILAATLLAMVVFFYIERILHARHQHQGSESHVHHHSGSRYFILVGDGLHNAIDGAAIALGFIVDPALGVATTLAVVAHELPHEVADYAILVRSGYSRRRALWLNFLSGLTAVAGAAAVFIGGAAVESQLAWLMAAAAGMFIYIASVNLLPELHHQRLRGRLLYGTPFVSGVVLIAVLGRLLGE